MALLQNKLCSVCLRVFLFYAPNREIHHAILGKTIVFTVSAAVHFEVWLPFWVITSSLKIKTFFSVVLSKPQRVKSLKQNKRRRHRSLPHSDTIWPVSFKLPLQDWNPTPHTLAICIYEWHSYWHSFSFRVVFMGRRHRQKYKRCKQFRISWNGLIVLFKKVQTVQKWLSQNALRQVFCVQVKNSAYKRLRQCWNCLVLDHKRAQQNY